MAPPATMRMSKLLWLLHLEYAEIRVQLEKLGVVTPANIDFRLHNDADNGPWAEPACSFYYHATDNIDVILNASTLAIEWDSLPSWPTQQCLRAFIIFELLKLHQSRKGT